MACTNGKCELAGRIRYYREAGMDALREGNLSRAEDQLRLAVALAERDEAVDTTLAQSSYRLGLVLSQAGRPDEAAEAFERALALVDGRAGCESKLYRRILGHYAEALPERARALRQ